MNPDPLLAWLADALIKSSVIFALAAAVTRVWRGAPGASRHLVWLAAFGAALALPLTRVASPLWAWDVALEQSSAAGSIASAPTPGTPGAALVTAGGARAELPTWAAGWREWVLAAWMGGIALLLAYRAMGSVLFYRMWRRSRAVGSARVLSLAREMARACGIEAELRESATARAPMTWGVRKPVVLLPISAGDWPEVNLRAALRHEFTHIRRRDCLSRLLAQVATAIYWVNPAVWLAARELRLAQEIACDDAVLSAGMDGTDYAEQLVAMAREAGSRLLETQGGLAMAAPSTLATRVRSIVNPQVNRGPATRTNVVFTCGSGAAMVLLLTLAQVRAANQSSPTASVPHQRRYSPIDIHADSTSYENGVAIANGDVEIRWTSYFPGTNTPTFYILDADNIRLDTRTKDIAAKGHIRLEHRGPKQGRFTTTATTGSVTINMKTQSATYSGPTHTEIEEYKGDDSSTQS